MVRTIVFIALLPFYCTGQVWEFSAVESLKAGVNTEYEEAFPLISPDGRTLYFSRILYPQNQGGKFSGSDIWMSVYDEKKKTWGKAVSVEKLNDRGNSSVVGINADNKTLYVMKTTSAGKPSGIYFSRKIGSTWSRPELIPIPNLDPQGFLSFFVSPDFEVIFISMKGPDSRGEEDIYVSTKSLSGEWSVPKNLGSTVNTSGFEISPFLSQDKKRLYFSSNGHKGFGDADIFYCDRLYNSWDTWSAPRNLGEKLNSKGFDGYFSLYGDSIAYFTSNRGGRYADIYSVKVIPGNEVLAFGQRYLNTDETSKTLGANVSRKISFAMNTTSLTAAQKELLFFIANKIAPHREINVQIMVLEENTPALTEQRLKAVADELRASGLETIRVVTTPNDRFRKKNETQAIYEILLFK
jgi:hypothetical protein